MMSTEKTTGRQKWSALIFSKISVGSSIYGPLLPRWPPANCQEAWKN